jgi:hypothetical protein
MNRPYEHTLTQADRIAFQKWLLGISAFWGLSYALDYRRRNHELRSRHGNTE